MSRNLHSHRVPPPSPFASALQEVLRTPYAFFMTYNCLSDSRRAATFGRNAVMLGIAGSALVTLVLVYLLPGIFSLPVPVPSGGGALGAAAGASNLVPTKDTVLWVAQGAVVMILISPVIGFAMPHVLGGVFHLGYVAVEGGGAKGPDDVPQGPDRVTLSPAALGEKAPLEEEEEEAPRPYDRTFCVAGYACAPWVFLPIPLLGTTVAIAGSVVLGMIGMQAAHNLPRRRALFACALPLVAVFLLFSVAVGNLLSHAGVLLAP